MRWLAHLSHGHGLHRPLVLHCALQPLLPEDLVRLIGEEHGIPIEHHAEWGAGGLHLLLEDERCGDPCETEQGEAQKGQPLLGASRAWPAPPCVPSHTAVLGSPSQGLSVGVSPFLGLCYPPMGLDKKALLIRD